MTMASTDRVRVPQAKTSGEEPALSEAIRVHLGQLLGTALIETEAEQHAAAQFATQLAKLDAALGGLHDGCEAEFQKLLTEVVPVLRRYAISITRNRHVADDMVQDTLLRAWRSRASFVMGTNFEAWTFTILRNHFYSTRRKIRETQDEDGAHAARLAVLPEQPDHLEMNDVQAALAKLSPQMREALVLVTVSGASYEQAAVILGCQLGTIKSRVSRGREQLLRILGYGEQAIGQDPFMLSAMKAKA